MNRQELIKRINDLWSFVFEDEPFEIDSINKSPVIDLISQIDEPQKVVVPKYIADWYDYAKKQNFSLSSALEHWSMSEEVEKWFSYSYNQETFAHAWLDGYEVEKEKLYEVIIPHTSNYKNQNQYLVKQGKNWFFCGNDVNRFKYHFTKGQIEAAGFGWVFEKGFAKEVE